VTRWQFGAEPLPQTTKAAALLREVTSLVVAMEHDDDEVALLIADLQRASTALATRVPPSSLPRVGAATDSDGRLYLDHAYNIGTHNPCFPEYAITIAGDRAEGTVNFPIVYEGPPGLVHGGFLAVFFDCIVQHHNCEVGTAGKTTSLTVSYRRPTPLESDLSFVIERLVDADRINSTAQLFHGDRLLCAAEVSAIAGNRSNLPPTSPRRDGNLDHH
jgi:hypothetical protein